MTHNRTSGSLLLGLSSVCFVGAWAFAVYVFRIPQYLVPTPAAVARDFYGNYPDYLAHVNRTISEAAGGFLLAVVLAFAIGIALFRLRAIRRILLPWITALQAVPIVAIAPLLVVWLGSGIASKIAMSTTIAFFPMLAAILAGFSEVDLDTRQLFQIYHARYLTTVRHLLLPASLPAITTGMKVSAGLAIVGAIVAEMTGADKGLGSVILNASYRLQTPKLFVGIILSGLVGATGYCIPDVLRFFYPKTWSSNRLGGPP